jgi:DNA polymerase-3 subunit gamma/tau
LAITAGSHLDLIEIDAASNRNIDDVRDLREKIKLSPVQGRFKVYIIDEVHMLTKEAFNALLKTLEEPPSHAIFVLCTTEIAKLPQTIISRVQRFGFTRATDNQLSLAIKRIASNEAIKIDQEAIPAIIKASDGSFRDAVSLLDQLSASKKIIKAGDVKNLALSTNWNILYGFVENLGDDKLKEAVTVVEEIWKEGADVSFFTREAILFLEKILFIKIGLENKILELESDQFEKMMRLGQKFNFGQVQDLIRLFLIVEGEIKLYPLPQIPLVLAVCKFCQPPNQTQEQEMEEQKSNTLDSSTELENPLKSQPKEISINSKKGKKSLVLIQKNWNKFLDKVRPVNTNVMAILRSTRPLECDGVNLTLEVFYRFHKEKMEEPKILTMLEGILEETMGKSLRLKFILSKRETPPSKQVLASDVIDVREEDLERIATEIFSK